VNAQFAALTALLRKIEKEDAARRSTSSSLSIGGGSSSATVEGGSTAAGAGDVAEGPEDEDCANLDADAEDRRKTTLVFLNATGRTGCPTNRADLIAMTICVLERLHLQNGRLRRESRAVRTQLDASRKVGEELAIKHKQAEAAAHQAAVAAAARAHLPPPPKQDKLMMMVPMMVTPDQVAGVHSMTHGMQMPVPFPYMQQCAPMAPLMYQTQQNLTAAASQTPAQTHSQQMQHAQAPSAAHIPQQPQSSSTPGAPLMQVQQLQHAQQQQNPSTALAVSSQVPQPQPGASQMMMMSVANPNIPAQAQPQPQPGAMFHPGGYPMMMQQMGMPGGAAFMANAKPPAHPGAGLAGGPVAPAGGGMMGQAFMMAPAPSAGMGAVLPPVPADSSQVHLSKKEENSSSSQHVKTQLHTQGAAQGHQQTSPSLQGSPFNRFPPPPGGGTDGAGTGGGGNLAHCA